MPTDPNSATRAVRASLESDLQHGAVVPPLHMSSTFTFAAFGEKRQYDYTRSGNPTRDALERNVAALEGGAGAVACATGMGAITAAVMMFNAGDHLIAGNDIYGGTYRLFSQVLPAHGVEVSFVNLRDHDAVRAAVKLNTKGLWIETPSNPLLNIIDIKAMVEIAKDAGAMTLLDNTFLSPIFQQPFGFGQPADQVGGVDALEAAEVVAQVHRVALLEAGVSGVDPVRQARHQLAVEVALVVSAVGERAESDRGGGGDEGLGEVDADHLLAVAAHLVGRAADGAAEVESAGDAAGVEARLGPHREVERLAHPGGDLGR